MNILRYILTPKLFVAAVSVVVASVAGYGLLNSGALALPEDCDDIAIIRCGFQDKNGFKADYNANVKGDIKTIFADPRFNFTADEMDRFMKTAVWATAYKDGRLVLDDGRVVATKSWSLGRTKAGGANPHTTKIGGTTYYWGYNSTAFASNSIRALVMMDKNNKYMEFAVLTSCGNPITGTKPVFQCDMLNKNQISDTKFEFWTNVTAKNGASVKSLTYTFGDGTTATVTNPAEKVPHTYAKPGNYNVTVTVTYTVNGKEQKEAIQAKCKTSVTVKEEEKPKPFQECKSLTIITKNKEEREYEFVVVTNFDKTTKLVSVDFDFGDKQKANAIKPEADGKTVKTLHKYDKKLTGTVTITSTAHFTSGKDEVSKNCTAKLDFQKPPEQPKILPATGPIETMLGAIGIGSVTGAGLYYLGTRRDLIATLLNR